LCFVFSFISPFVLCFPCCFLFLISTSRHNTTNFLSLAQQQHFPLTQSAAAATAVIFLSPQQQHSPLSRSSSNNFLTHSAAAEPAVKTLAAAIALKFHPKHEKRKKKP